MSLIKERDKALKRARAFARLGEPEQAQIWLERATVMWPVTPRQIKGVLRLTHAS